MSFSSGDELLLAGLLAAGLLLLSIAQFVRIPYPILLVLGGLALAFIPGVPRIELRPEIGRRVNDIVMRCLAKDPKARYGNAGELLHDLDTVQMQQRSAAA